MTTLIKNISTLLLSVPIIFVNSVFAEPLPLTQKQIKLIDKPMQIKEQGSFFVGGWDYNSKYLSTLAPKYKAEGTVSLDQMYVRYQIPVSASKTSLVLIHGCCLTGKTWETTPDGRIGWDEYLVRNGYATYTVDQSNRGRSAVNIDLINQVKTKKKPVSDLPTIFSVGREDAWTIFRFGPKYLEKWEKMQFPLEAKEEFWKQMVPDWSVSLGDKNPNIKELSLLAKKVGHTVLMSHSQSGVFPFQALEMDPSGIDGIIALEPARCPDAKTDITAFTKLPILVVFGDYIDKSTRWSPRFKGCTEFTDAVNKKGGNAKLLSLPKIGIYGNSHMFMQDYNNLQIADLLVDWIETNIKN